MRYILRLLSLLCLVAATGVATLDTIRSVARAGLMLTTVGEGLESVAPAAHMTLTGMLAGKPAFLIQASLWLMAQPLAAIGLGLALLLWMAGYRKLPAAGRFAA